VSEAPSSAIAQLGQLDDAGRRRFGRITLWLTLGIVGAITLGLTAEAVHLRIGVPAAGSTQIADLAHRAAPGALYAVFQLVTATLLLSAASSSFQAGPGLLKALARRHGARGGAGVLPALWGGTNRHHTPYWGVAGFLAVSGTVIAAVNVAVEQRCGPASTVRLKNYWHRCRCHQGPSLTNPASVIRELPLAGQTRARGPSKDLTVGSWNPSLY
jgi:hypothetical protein